MNLSELANIFGGQVAARVMVDSAPEISPDTACASLYWCHNLFACHDSFICYKGFKCPDSVTCYDEFECRSCYAPC